MLVFSTVAILGALLLGKLFFFSKSEFCTIKPLMLNMS